MNQSSISKCQEISYDLDRLPGRCLGMVVVSAEGGLNGYMLNAAQRREKERRGWDESIAGLTELVDDGYVGPAAREALRCVRDAGADPRLLLLIVEAAQEGFFAPTMAQLEHSRRIAPKGGRAKAASAAGEEA